MPVPNESVADLIIDRLAPTRRPAGWHVMRQKWRHLLFLHWTFPPEQIQPLLPPGIELDTFEGQAYVGLVPFTMLGVRPVGTPTVPLLSNFHETNVRTYVHRNGRDPGVWFFSLDAANALAVHIARAWYRLPYHFARMNLEINSDRRQITYHSERLWPAPTPASCSVRYRPTGPVTRAQNGTLEHFLVERYLLYAYAHGKLYSGQVHHPPYPLQTAQVMDLQENMLAAAGIQRPETEPLIHYAREVRVFIYTLRPVTEEK